MEFGIMIGVLCLASFFLLCWALLLLNYIRELEKKVTAFGSYFSVRKKLDEL